MEQCQKIERVTRFGIYFPIRSQPDKAGIPYVLTDWGIKNRFWKRYHMKKNIILWMAASAVVMLAFPWLAGETAFILYAAGYLTLGIAAMLISMLIRKKTQK